MGFINSSMRNLELKIASPNYSAAEKAGFKEEITKIEVQADSVQTAQKAQQDSRTIWDKLKNGGEIMVEQFNDKLDKTIDIWRK